MSANYDTLSAYREFAPLFGSDRAEALALAIGRVRADPAAAPGVAADLQRRGFTRRQADAVVGQAALSAIGKNPAFC